LEFLKLILAIIVIAPFLEKATDPNFILLSAAILLCGFIAHGNK
jgi:hypothetical protein